MDFSSILFIFIFLPIFLLIYYLSKDIKTKNILIVIFSLLFYGYGSPVYLFLIILLTIINYQLIKRNKTKLIQIMAIGFNVGVLLLCKYVFKVLPIGISFYVFEAISSFVNTYNYKTLRPDSLVEYSVYLLSFGKITSGPIEDYSNFENVYHRNINKDKLVNGIRRFIIGLAKKVLLANSLALIVEKLFTYDLMALGFLGSIVGAISYTLELYYDFSGYTDMALGIGLMLGFDYPENFNYPYSALSITDFWRRWHISLSLFFRNYVYIPLGGNRVNTLRHIFNLFVVWVLTGIWHGSSFNFIIWGLYYFVILVIEKYLLNKYLEKWPNILRNIYSLIIIIIGWIIFYFVDIDEMVIIFKNLIWLNGIGDLSIFSSLQLVTIPNILTIIIGTILMYPHNLKDGYPKDVVLIILFVLSIIFILSSSYQPFIYAQF